MIEKIIALNKQNYQKIGKNNIRLREKRAVLKIGN